MTPRELDAFNYWQVSTAYRRRGYAGTAGALALHRLVRKGRTTLVRSLAARLLLRTAGHGSPTQGGAA